MYYWTYLLIQYVKNIIKCDHVFSFFFIFLSMIWLSLVELQNVFNKENQARKALFAFVNWLDHIPIYWRSKLGHFCYNLHILAIPGNEKFVPEHKTLHRYKCTFVNVNVELDLLDKKFVCKCIINLMSGTSKEFLSTFW